MSRRGQFVLTLITLLFLSVIGGNDAARGQSALSPASHAALLSFGFLPAVRAKIWRTCRSYQASQTFN